MSLATQVNLMLDRRLSDEESAALAKFQKLHDIGDEDPLVIVLGFLAAHGAAMESIPGRLEKSVATIIELHRQTLREQSTVLARELLVEIAPRLRQPEPNIDWSLSACAVLLGALGTLVVDFSFRHFF